MNSTFAESNKWRQSKSLGMYKLLKECSRNHCARILPRVGTDVSNFRHGRMPLNCDTPFLHLSEAFVKFSCATYLLVCSLLFQEFNSEPVLPIYSARPDQVAKALKHVYNVALHKLKGKELELVLAILPDNNGALYGKFQSC
jgi:hypothetical protein